MRLGEAFHPVQRDFGASMSAYTRQRDAQSTVLDREIADMLRLGQPLDCVAYLSELEGKETAQRWSDAIRRVVLRDVERDHVRFWPEPLHEANTAHERRFCALMLIIQSELSTAKPKDLRAWTRFLYRGRQHTWRVSDDGEWDRKYVKTGHTGGLAARLDCSVRNVARYLAVAKAAGLISVWQLKGKEKTDKLPLKLKGKRWAYSCIRWLGELPRRVWDRLTGRIRVPAVAPELETPPPARDTGASPPAESEADDWVELVRTGRAGRSRAPS